MQLLTLLAWALLPGCWAVTGPGTVWGFLGGSLSLNCTYEAGYERYPKFWCTPRKVTFTCGTDIVITSERHPEVRRGRFFIRDDRQHRVITVTVEPLGMRDAGTFLCGVRTGTFRSDETADVEVIVLEPPGPSKLVPLPAATVATTSRDEATTLIPVTALPATTPRPAVAAADAALVAWRYFPALAGLQVLALLAMSAAVLWLSLRG